MKFCVSIGKVTSPSTPLPLAGDFVRSMEKARNMGYDAVEIHTPDIKALDVEEIRSACSRLNMFVATLGTGQLYGRYGMYLMDEDPARQERIVEEVKTYIDVAGKLGSKVTIGSIKGNVPKGGDREACLAVMADCLKKISAYAVEKGVTVLLEATNHYENNVLNTGAEAAAMIRENQLENFQVLMDSYHINMEETNLQGCLRDVKEYLGHIHFADNTRHFPGSGIFNFDAFCNAIREIGYDGVLSVECYPLPDEDTAALKSIEFFRKYF